jgi:hypothetical protein
MKVNSAVGKIPHLSVGNNIIYGETILFSITNEGIEIKKIFQISQLDRP